MGRVGRDSTLKRPTDSGRVGPQVRTPTVKSQRDSERVGPAADRQLVNRDSGRVGPAADRQLVNRDSGGSSGRASSGRPRPRMAASTLLPSVTVPAPLSDRSHAAVGLQ